MEQLSSASVVDFLQPAVDGPPSPQKLRQLSKKMQRSSNQQSRPGHKSAMSESLSVSSTDASDYLPWELNPDVLSIVRRPSNRSNDSGTPARDRPESVPSFGRGFFQRRGKSRRESSLHSSAASSVYSGDAIADAHLPGGKEGLIPSIFTRRFSSRDDPAQKRPSISGPFNFRHVVHTQRKEIEEDGALSKRHDMPTDGTRHKHDFLSRGPKRSTSLEPLGDWSGQSSDQHFLRPTLMPRHTTPGSKTLRSSRHIRIGGQPGEVWSTLSSAKLTEPAFVVLPPPRSSSHQPCHRNTADSLVLDHLTSLQQAASGHDLSGLDIGTVNAATDSPLSNPQSSPSPRKNSHLSDNDRHVWGTEVAQNAAWPLTSPTLQTYEAALPDVPEEDEHQSSSRRSRLSPASNGSSLRGSHSVPMLRSLVEAQSSMYDLMETPGGLGIVGVGGAPISTAQSSVQENISTKEIWEDLIDYCYDHEAEADCDYQWDRPSLDTNRDSITPPAQITVATEEGLELEYEASSSQACSSVSPLSSHAPSFGTASPRSSKTRSEAVTPSSAGPSNFSLPRPEQKASAPTLYTNLQTSSGDPLDDESDVLAFSPSLLVPSDYHSEVSAPDSKRLCGVDQGLMASDCHLAHAHEDAGLLGGPVASPSIEHRFSTSTTGTDSTCHSNLTGLQYRSTNSSWTTLTRRTASNSSLNKMSNLSTDESGPLPSIPLTGLRPEAGNWSALAIPGQEPLPDRMAPLSMTEVKLHQHHRMHASESQICEGAFVSSPTEIINRPRRSRARTTSAQFPPPVGQYAFFPRANVKMTGDHI